MQFNAKMVRQRLVAIRSNRLFEAVVIGIILFSALLIGAKTYDFGPFTMRLLHLLDWAVTIFFLVEIIIRMLAEGSLRAFFSRGWNVFDFVIVAASMIPIGPGDTALLGRLLRIFRVLRLISIIPELRVLMNAFLHAIPRMGYVSLMMFIIFYIYAAMGSIFFERINPDLWENITISMLTLFRVATFEDWTDVMYETMGVYPLSWIYYLSFIFIVAFVFLNMMIGIVVETLQQEHDRQALEQGDDTNGRLRRLEAQNERIDSRLEGMERLLKQVSAQLRNDGGP